MFENLAVLFHLKGATSKKGAEERKTLMRLQPAITTSVMAPDIACPEVEISNVIKLQNNSAIHTQPPHRGAVLPGPEFPRPNLNSNHEDGARRPHFFIPFPPYCAPRCHLAAMPVATRRAPASYRLSQRHRLLHGQGEMAGHLMPLPAARLKGGRAGAAQIRCMGQRW